MQQNRKSCLRISQNLNGPWKALVASSNLQGSSLVAETRSRADSSSLVKFVPCCGNIQGDADTVGFAKEGTFQQKEGWVGVSQVNKMCEVKKKDERSTRKDSPGKENSIYKGTCQCVESRLPSLDCLMCVEKWKAMRWDGQKSRHLEGPCVSCKGVGFCSEAFGSC